MRDPRGHDWDRAAHPKCIWSQYIGWGLRRHRQKASGALLLISLCFIPADTASLLSPCYPTSPPWWTVPQTVNQNHFLLLHICFFLGHRNEVSNAPSYFWQHESQTVSGLSACLSVCVCLCICAHEGRRSTQGTFLTFQLLFFETRSISD